MAGVALASNTLPGVCVPGLTLAGAEAPAAGVLATIAFFVAFIELISDFF
jgi:hypothetical protein